MLNTLGLQVNSEMILPAKSDQNQPVYFYGSSKAAGLKHAYD